MLVWPLPLDLVLLCHTYCCYPLTARPCSPMLSPLAKACLAGGLHLRCREASAGQFPFVWKDRSGSLAHPSCTALSWFTSTLKIMCSSGPSALPCLGKWLLLTHYRVIGPYGNFIFVYIFWNCEPLMEWHCQKNRSGCTWCQSKLQSTVSCQNSWLLNSDRKNRCGQRYGEITRIPNTEQL